MNYFLDTLNLKRLKQLVEHRSMDNLGDLIEEATGILTSIREPAAVIQAEDYMKTLLQMAQQVDIGWRLFANVPKPAKDLDDRDYIQLLTVGGSLNEFCYCFESLEHAARIDAAMNTNPGSNTPIRFYINTMCHYVSAYFLLNYGENKTAGFDQAGNLVKALQPLGLERLLNPARKVLEKPLGDTTFGETIRIIRNKNLVHNNFLPSDIQQLVVDTGIFSFQQQLLWKSLFRELFSALLVLKLKIFAILSGSSIDMGEAARNQLRQLYGL